MARNPNHRLPARLRDLIARERSSLAAGVASDHVLPVDPDLDDTRLDASHRDRLPGRAARRTRPDVLAAMALGGALGTLARYAIARGFPTPSGRFPWATFGTNISGAFVLGALLVVLIERFPPRRYARPFLAVGFLGAYTTFSTYMVETDLLVRGGHATVAAVYLVASLVAGLAAAYAGVAVARPRRSHAPRTEAT